MKASDEILMLALPRVRIEQLDDAQFFQEPRLRLLQRAFHDVRRTMDLWASIGVMGEAAKKTADVSQHLGEALAQSKLPRLTLHPHHDKQIKYALTMARELNELLKAQGVQADPAEVPDVAPGWCNLGAQTLGTQLLWSDGTLWLYVPYHPVRDAREPLYRVSRVQPVNGGDRETCTVRMLKVHDESVHNRVTEVVELGRWALRQPQYVPLEK